MIFIFEMEFHDWFNAIHNERRNKNFDDEEQRTGHHPDMPDFKSSHCFAGKLFRSLVEINVLLKPGFSNCRFLSGTIR